MTTQESIKILKSHRRWMTGEDVPAVCPVMLGEAIDQAVKDLGWITMASQVGKTIVAETEVKFTPSYDQKNICYKTLKPCECSGLCRDS